MIQISGDVYKWSLLVVNADHSGIILTSTIVFAHKEMAFIGGIAGRTPIIVLLPWFDSNGPWTMDNLKDLVFMEPLVDVWIFCIEDNINDWFHRIFFSFPESKTDLEKNKSLVDQYIPAKWMNACQKEEQWTLALTNQGVTELSFQWTGLIRVVALRGCPQWQFELSAIFTGES